VSEGHAAGDGSLSTRERILAAAITRFARDGVSRTRLRDIAGDVGVSAPLILHHFGSKDGLRTACDAYVAARIRASKHDAMRKGLDLDVTAAFRSFADGPPLMAYLARTLVDGGEHVARLVDELVDDAVAYLAEGERTGLVRSSPRPRERAVVLVLWQLGALVLHEHAARLLGVDLTDGGSGALGWAAPASEILALGVIDPTMHARLLAASIEDAGG
jgi:AcrR family transcriptional regulator